MPELTVGQHGLKMPLLVALDSSSSFLEINHEPKHGPQFDWHLVDRAYDDQLFDSW
jgi:hypothetical protein